MFVANSPSSTHLGEHLPSVTVPLELEMGVKSTGVVLRPIEIVLAVSSAGTAAVKKIRTFVRIDTPIQLEYR